METSNGENVGRGVDERRAGAGAGGGAGRRGEGMMMVGAGAGARERVGEDAASRALKCGVAGWVLMVAVVAVAVTVSVAVAVVVVEQNACPLIPPALSARTRCVTHSP